MGRYQPVVFLLSIYRLQLEHVYSSYLGLVFGLEEFPSIRDYCLSRIASFLQLLRKCFLFGDIIVYAWVSAGPNSVLNTNSRLSFVFLNLNAFKGVVESWRCGVVAKVKRYDLCSPVSPSFSVFYRGPPVLSPAYQA